jgi:hypothetical protein
MTSTRATEPVAELKRFRAAERRILGWLRRLVDVADEGLHGWEVAHREEAGRGEFSSPELGAAGTSPAEADAKELMFHLRKRPFKVIRHAIHV